jgi:hypothetical protein
MKGELSYHMPDWKGRNKDKTSKGRGKRFWALPLVDHK